MSMMLRRRTLAESAVVIFILSIFSGAATAADVDTFLTRAVIAIANKEYDRAYDIYSDGLKQKFGMADRAKLLRFRALASDLAGKKDQAEADYTTVVGLTGSSDPNAYSSRGYFYYNRERFDLSLADYTAGARHFPNDGVFPYGQGRALNAFGKFDEAIGRFEEAIRLDPTSGEFMLGRAEAYNQSARPEQALRDYDKALTLRRLVRNDLGRLHVGRGHANLKLERYETAIADFNTALDLRPGLINAWKWRALSFERLGDISRACRDYEAARKLRPSDDVVSNRLKLVCNT